MITSMVDSFNDNYLFGTGGIRGVFCQSLTTELCREVAMALGSILPFHCHVCVASDTRDRGTELVIMVIAETISKKKIESLYFNGQ